MGERTSPLAGTGFRACALDGLTPHCLNLDTQTSPQAASPRSWCQPDSDPLAAMNAAATSSFTARHPSGTPGNMTAGSPHSDKPLFHPRNALNN